MFTGKPENLCDLLYCGDVEPNLQHLRGMPVFVFELIRPFQIIQNVAFASALINYQSGLLGFRSLSLARYSREHNVSETGSVAILRSGLGRHLLCWPVRKRQPQSLGNLSQSTVTYISEIFIVHSLVISW
jgi:hypothetical protein